LSEGRPQDKFERYKGFPIRRVIYNILKATKIRAQRAFILKVDPQLREKSRISFKQNLDSQTTHKVSKDLKDRKSLKITRQEFIITNADA
jgi:predicted transcriptional regulator